MKYKYILFFIILLTACKQKREVHPTFYYWKTVYRQKNVELNYLDKFKSKKIYVRMMDVDMQLDRYYNNAPFPVAPITFADTIPERFEIVPVVFVVNDVLMEKDPATIKWLASNILRFVKGKLLQTGRKEYKELQIDCDWTKTTKDNYFLLLNELRRLNKGKTLSVTLRLHQLKNQNLTGIPPADKVMLMCYNMGNLRQFGEQNSIFDKNELEKYAGKNLSAYPLGLDIALPLFSWSVIFRDKRYHGISKKITKADLTNKTLFWYTQAGFYQANIDMPLFAIRKDDLIKHEEVNLADVKETAKYLSSYLSDKPINLVYFHLDDEVINKYNFNELEEIAHILH